MKAQVTAHKDFTISEIDNRDYGAFLEHWGRAIYTGIYEPEHLAVDKKTACAICVITIIERSFCSFAVNYFSSLVVPFGDKLPMLQRNSICMTI